MGKRREYVRLILAVSSIRVSGLVDLSAIRCGFRLGMASNRDRKRAMKLLEELGHGSGLDLQRVGAVGVLDKVGSTHRVRCFQYHSVYEVTEWFLKIGCECGVAPAGTV